MKKRILTLGTVFTLCAAILVGCSKEDKKEDPTPAAPQEEAIMASKDPSNRVAILEDFTGVRCGYCPDGHRVAKEMIAANPGKVIVLAVHAGGYAAPATGWANFTTPFGEAIDDLARPLGYPAGTLNRIRFEDLVMKGTDTWGTEISSNLAMSRGDWPTAASRVLAMPSPVNVGAKATFNASTRELTVTMDAYYTAGETAKNHINVALVQNKLMSKQSGASGMYEQNHVLRHLLTGQWGEPITTSTEKGGIVRKTYKYTVPADYNGTAVEGGGAVVIENCKVVTFIAREKTEILTGVEVPITVE